ncbi:TAP-like protein [Frondihabitans sp. PhB188]|uniref:alpha/beta hydrolase n=1 Tax=Frondihabitans sp. PhB188 TaxID=2485200 RepID=UPI000F486144|nr:alpha/beta hydrolase [Frondihabitans sp. PhB188]ROQ39605.1 TAP-like protein [Frondihabitans sp. PhB188]
MTSSTRGTVVVLGGGDPGGDLGHVVDALALAGFRVETLPDVTPDIESARAAVVRAFDDTANDLPRVLVGSGVGATLAAGLAASRPIGIEALVLANVVTASSRGVELPDGIALPAARSVRQPTLVFHGDRDAVTDIADAASWATQLPFGVVRVVHGGGHDVLGGESRRSVAAAIVLFVERQRAGAPVLTDGFA